MSAPPMNHEPTQKRPSFFWQGALILFPLLVFAAIGTYLLIQDRSRVEKEAREECLLVVERLAEFAAKNLAVRSREDFRKLRADTRSGISVFRSGYQVPDMTIQGSPRATGVPRIVLDADGDGVQPAVYPKWPKPSVETNAAASRLNLLWLAAEQALAEGRTNDARTNFIALAVEVSPVFTEAGLPLQPLASLRLLELALPGDVSATSLQLASNAVEFPSIVTPFLLDAAYARASKSGKQEIDQGWRQLWEQQEESRGLAGHLRSAKSGFPSASVGFPFWVNWRGQGWFVAAVTNGPVSDQGSFVPRLGLHVFSLSALSNAVADILETSAVKLPAYAGAVFELGGRQIGDVRAGSVLADASVNWLSPESILAKPEAMRFPEQAVPGFAVRIHLVRPQLLYALQRERTLLFGGLIGGSLLVSLVGLVTARRAFLRQLALNEQKSDFVSAVSHELRAPIAAVRLMTENLTRGAPAEPERKREYFRLILQECRRLSALIENVLDFSRIEQGRKEYEFEPTDLRALCQATVALMQPIGSDHGVGVELEPPDPGAAPDAPVDCDGRAIQQALVNLIDNAIKHSPTGACVRVALNHAENSASICVTDRGPGIPPKERERVFEQFHRLGSELRRETQGVGIGLSIVRHIVSSHGGRVWVEDGAEGGSRFTLELPRKPRT